MREWWDFIVRIEEGHPQVAGDYAYLSGPRPSASEVAIAYVEDISNAQSQDFVVGVRLRGEKHWEKVVVQQKSIWMAETIEET